MNNPTPREVLLIEPNYRNKYPPMGLMKLATYYKQLGDNVRFFKGEMSDLAVELICKDLLTFLNALDSDKKYNRYITTLMQYIKFGRSADISDELTTDEMVLETIKSYRMKYKSQDYFKTPRFDVVCITTLFTFYWETTIETINFAKRLCKNQKKVFVGGIASTIVPEYIEKETGIRPKTGILDKPNVLDSVNELKLKGVPVKKRSLIIDTLPLDYSILHEIDYQYPATDAYFAYMTRGCVNKCAFCAVPKLEPDYQKYIQLKEQLLVTNEIYGEQRHLLLLDNNVLASECFPQIIDEIKACGFAKSAMFTPTNQYELAIRNLRNNINDRAYIRICIKIYHQLIDKCRDEDIRNELYKKVYDSLCDNEYTATKDAILELDSFVAPLYKKYVYRQISNQRYVDFNQGVDARLITPEKMNKLSEIAIRPLRIAFDNWGYRHVYETAVRAAVDSGITQLSNYMLYNFNDSPVDLYRRMRLTVDLCEELNVAIYSFPMKYHPIDDPEYFRNREYIGNHWCRKYIRAVQAVLTSTHGKVGRGLNFFEAAFGRTEEEFHEILLMPEALIIRRYEHDEDMRLRNPKHSKPEYTSRLTNNWREQFYSLSDSQREQAVAIIRSNRFTDNDIAVEDMDIHEVLRFYQILRNS